MICRVEGSFGDCQMKSSFVQGGMWWAPAGPSPKAGSSTLCPCCFLGGAEQSCNLDTSASSSQLKSGKMCWQGVRNARNTRDQLLFLVFGTVVVKDELPRSAWWVNVQQSSSFLSGLISNVNSLSSAILILLTTKSDSSLLCSWFFSFPDYFADLSSLQPEQSLSR